MKNIVDNATIEKIKAHIANGVRRSERNMMYLDRDEDAITGSLLDNLLQPEWQTTVGDDGSLNRWKIIVHKARGRGPNALENYTGADGIIQIHVFDSQTRAVFRKGLLFQAKKGELPSLRTAVVQASRMEALALNSSAVFLYNDGIFMGIASQNLIEDGRDGKAETEPLEEFINDRFLECTVGAENLFYDYYRRQQLVLPVGIIDIPIDQVNHAEIYVKMNQ